MGRHSPEAELLGHLNGGRVQVNVLRGQSGTRISIYCREGDGWVGESLPVTSVDGAEEILLSYAEPTMFGDLGLTGMMVGEALAVVGQVLANGEIDSLGLYDPLLPIEIVSEATFA